MAFHAWAGAGRGAAGVAALGIVILLASAATGAAVPANDAAPTPAVDFDLPGWLATQPRIAAALVWEEPSGTVVPHSAWPADMQHRLAELVARIGRGEAPNLAEAPPLVRPVDPALPFPPLNPELARWSPEVARETYLAYSAQSLAVEIGRWVQWSIAPDDAKALALLLDSRTLWRAEPRTGTYRIPYEFGATTPGDPYRAFQFLRAQSLIGATSRDTIERLVGWIGRNVVHFQGDWNAANVYATWQYYGWPPLERILAGTTSDGDPRQGVRRRAGACFGAVGLMRLLLRTVNIPVELLHPCPGHGVPHFVREDLYLSHGDDPYSSLLIATPPIPPAALLIDRGRYEGWLASDEVSITMCKNIGRQVRELAISHLPDELLATRCTDRSAATDPPRSRVYDIFKFDYSVEQLEQRTLWQRLDEKIAALGGCETLNANRPGGRTVR
jgi:hypothetical protein